MWTKITATGFELGFSMRSAEAVVAVPLTIIWAGGISVFILHEGFQFVLLYFMAALLWLIPWAVMSIGGRHVLRVEDGRAEIFKGIGQIGVRRRFGWKDVEEITVEKSSFGSKGREFWNLVLKGNRGYRLGLDQQHERLQYALRFLRPFLGDQPQTSGSATEPDKPVTG